MTISQSNTRLALYIFVAVLTSLLPDLQELKAAILEGTKIIVVDYVIMAAKASLAGGIIWRAFIDKTTSEVDPKKDQP